MDLTLKMVEDEIQHFEVEPYGLDIKITSEMQDDFDVMGKVQDKLRASMKDALEEEIMSSLKNATMRYAEIPYGQRNPRLYDGHIPKTKEEWATMKLEKLTPTQKKAVVALVQSVSNAAYDEGHLHASDNQHRERLRIQRVAAREVVSAQRILADALNTLTYD